jgi:hypothetical protein
MRADAASVEVIAHMLRRCGRPVLGVLAARQRPALLAVVLDRGFPVCRATVTYPGREVCGHVRLDADGPLIAAGVPSPQDVPLNPAHSVADRSPRIDSPGARAANPSPEAIPPIAEHDQ